MKSISVIGIILLGMAVVKGTDYAVGFLHLGSPAYVDVMQSNLLMTAAGRVVVNVSMNILNQTVKIKGGGYFRFVMDPHSERAKKQEDVENTAVFMTSHQDFCVHAVTLDYESFGGFQPQPIKEYSTEFFIASYPVTGWRNTEFLVVASEDDTNINYTIRDTATGQYGPVKNITGLNRHDKYQVKSKRSDFTGTYVTSDKPIAVFAGVDCAHVPVDTVKFRQHCDHMSVGVPPVAKLGKRYILGPLVGRSEDVGYLVRVIGTQNQTTVEAYESKNVESRLIHRGGFWELNINTSTIVDIQCSAPCMVIQYSKSKVDQDDKWDNFMMTVPSVDDYANKVIWSNAVDRHGLGMINYANIIVPDGKQDGVRVNNRKVSQWKKSPGGDYLVGSYKQSFGAHNANHTDSSVKIGVMVYGRGTKEIHAFGYAACPAGSNFLEDEPEEEGADDYGEEEGVGEVVEEPETAAVCSAKEDDTLFPLWIILCILMGLVVGVVLAVFLVWLRVRKMKGVPGYIFNPCASYSDDMDTVLVDQKNVSDGGAEGKVHYRQRAEPNIYSEIEEPKGKKEVYFS